MYYKPHNILYQLELDQHIIDQTCVYLVDRNRGLIIVILTENLYLVKNKLFKY